MDFGEFIQSAEHNEPASERTKRELLDIVRAKARAAHNELPYPQVARKFSDDRTRGVCLTDWSAEGRYYGPPVNAEIVFYEKDKDGFDIRTSYEFLESSEGLNLAKYVEMDPAKEQETKQAERAAMELLSESMENDGGLERLISFLDALSEGQKQRMDERKVSEEKRWLDARAFADQLGTSVVLESEARALIDMICSANWDSNHRS